MRPYLLGDPGFPISEFIIPTFDRRGGMEPGKSSFNTRHSRARDVVERMFGVVKGRWRILRKAMEIIDPAFATLLIECCFLLHNFCLRNGQACPQAWVDEMHREQALAAAQGVSHQQPSGHAADDDGDDDGDSDDLAASRAVGVQLRNKLKLLHEQHPFVSSQL